jgi:hypothetical protein
MPLAPPSQLRTLRASLWFAARMAVSARHQSIDGTATASVAMACVELTDTTVAIAVGN